MQDMAALENGEDGSDDVNCEALAAVMSPTYKAYQAEAANRVEAAEAADNDADVD